MKRKRNEVSPPTWRPGPIRPAEGAGPHVTGARRQYCQRGTASRLCPAYQLKPPPLPIMCKWCMTTALQGYSTPHTQGVVGRPPCLCMGGCGAVSRRHRPLPGSGCQVPVSTQERLNGCRCDVAPSWARQMPASIAAAASAAAAARLCWHPKLCTARRAASAQS